MVQLGYSFCSFVAFGIDLHLMVLLLFGDNLCLFYGFSDMNRMLSLSNAVFFHCRHPEELTIYLKICAMDTIYFHCWRCFLANTWYVQLSFYFLFRAFVRRTVFAKLQEHQLNIHLNFF